jgi:tRNA threonylcarbamoyladenosine biosynthesis protein TsaE
MSHLGAALAPLLQPGDTVLLGGELGAGKTTFTKGLAAALGVAEPVTSPTFVLVRSYRTRAGWDLLHADVWRLNELQEVIDLAIPELQEEGAAAVVEWGELAAPALAPDYLHVEISFERAGQLATRRRDGASAARGAEEAADRSPRRLVWRAFGPSWESRMAELAARLASQE